MDTSVESFLNRSTFFTAPKRSLPLLSHHHSKLSAANYPTNLHFASRIPTNCIRPFIRNEFRFRKSVIFNFRACSRSSVANDSSLGVKDSVTSVNLGFIEVLVKRGIVLAAIVCGVVVIGCRRAFAAELVANSSWPKVLQVLTVFREQGLILAALLGLSAFFSMAETSITTLWPWKVRELAEKEPENVVFRMLRSDVTRFLTTILIGTTVVNIGATALVTEAATTIFGEAGISAATGVMTVRQSFLLYSSKNLKN